jgi:hypothetical protein
MAKGRYAFQIDLQGDALKEFAAMQNEVAELRSTVDAMGGNFVKLQKELRGTSDQMEKAAKSSKGIARELVATNRLITQTTRLFGAAFGVGQIADFTSEMVKSEQAVANSFGVSGDELQTLTGDVQRLATVYGKDYIEVIESANALNKRFGIEGSDALGLIEDALGKGVSTDFLSSIQELTPAFQKAGFSADAMLAHLTFADRLGLKDEFASAIEEATSQLSTLDNKDTIAVLDALGLSPERIKKGLDAGTLEIKDVIEQISTEVQKLPSSIEKQRALTTIFGDSGAALSSQLDLLQGFNEGLSSVANRTTDATKAQQSLLGAWADFKIYISQAIIPVMVEVVSWVRENQIVLIGLGKIALGVAGAMAGIWVAARAMRGINSIINAAKAAYTGFNIVLKAARTATLLLNLAMYANPFGLAVAGVVALGAAIYGVVAYWGEVKAFVSGIGELFMDAWNVVYDYFIRPIYDFFDWLTFGSLSGIGAFLGNIADWFGSAYDWIDANFFAPIKSWFDWLTGGALSVVEDTVKQLEAQQGQQTNDPNKGLFSSGEFGKFAAEQQAQLDTVFASLPKEVQMNIKAQGKTSGFGDIERKKEKGIGVSAGIAEVRSDSTKATNLTINIGKFQDQFIVQTTNLTESTTKVQEELTKALLRAVNDINQTT